MPAHRAYQFFYHQCTRGLDEDSRLEIDAVLGDDRAQAIVQEARRQSFELMDAEVG